MLNSVKLLKEKRYNNLCVRFGTWKVKFCVWIKAVSKSPQKRNSWPGPGGRARRKNDWAVPNWLKRSWPNWFRRRTFHVQVLNSMYQVRLMKSSASKPGLRGERRAGMDFWIQHWMELWSTLHLALHELSLSLTEWQVWFLWTINVNQRSEPSTNSSFHF